MPIVDKKPVDECIELLTQLKIILEAQNQEIKKMKCDITKLKASVSVISDGIKEHNEIQKKGWFY